MWRESTVNLVPVGRYRFDKVSGLVNTLPATDLTNTQLDMHASTSLLSFLSSIVC
jgi:hypothetical protein